MQTKNCIIKIKLPQRKIKRNRFSKKKPFLFAMPCAKLSGKMVLCALINIFHERVHFIS